MKHLLQWAVLILIVGFLTKAFGNESADPEAYCPMGGIETFATYLVNGSMACSMTTTQIMMGVLLAVGVILFGKLFCGYICPLGLVNELFYRLRRSLKWKAIKINNGSIADKLLRLIKYAVLFLIFYKTLSSSELFCKNFDPYYAFATGFKGELTVWMACISIGILFLGGLLVDMFWCKYICPLGAASNLFKFTLWFLGLIAVYAIITVAGAPIPWVYLLIAACVMGYLLEILTPNSKLNPQLLSVYRDTEKCNNCGVCAKRCPHHVEVNTLSKVNSIDCTLCGECVASCNQGALTITKRKWGKYLPALIVVVLFFVALFLGNKTELPTIDVQWNTEQVEGVELQNFEMTGLVSVKCYGSSMAFKAKLENIPGVYGVKTFVKHHRAIITYNPAQINEDGIRKSVYTPSKFRVNTPENDVTIIKIITIRTENMYDRMDANYLGLQLRNSGRRIYGLETEFACPLIVRLYVHPDEVFDKAFFKEMVEKDVLEMPVHGGGTREIECNYKFVKMEEGESFIELRPYLELMFSPFKAEFKERVSEFEGKTQEILEFANNYYETPLVFRNLPYLSNWLSQHEGVIGVYLILNEANLPAIQIRYANKTISADKVIETINKEEWTIKYKDGSAKQESPRFHFNKEDGKVISVK